MKRSFFEVRACAPIETVNPSTGNVIKVNPQKDALITDVDKDLRRLPGTYAWYCQLRDKAKKAFKDARHAEHCMEEDLYVKLSDDSLAEGRKRPTETELKMRIKVHPKMRKAYRARMEAAALLQELESAVSAIEMKKWALMSLTKQRIMEPTNDGE
jgi:hypothetical protein